MCGQIIKSQVNTVLTLTIDNPTKRNSLTPKMLKQLASAIKEADNNERVRSIIITSSSDKIFCSGFDISEIKTKESKPGSENIFIQNYFQKIYRSAKPIIAVINGSVYGAGCDLLTLCDFRLASKEVRFTIPAVNLGVLYDWRGIARLINLIGLDNVKELLLLGSSISAACAYRMGLITKIIPRSNLLDESQALANRLSEGAPLSIRATKKIANILCERVLVENIKSVIEKETELVWKSEDVTEGVTAFKEKRKPIFRGK